MNSDRLKIGERAVRTAGFPELKQTFLVLNATSAMAQMSRRYPSLGKSASHDVDR